MISKNEKTYVDIDFEDENRIVDSLKIIKAEYYRKAIKAFISIVLILSIYLIYLILYFQPNIILNNEVYVSTIRNYSFNLTVGWAFFSISLFVIIYLIKLIRLKFTPSLICFLKKEVKNVGFEVKKRFTSSLLFIILNTGAIALLLYIDFGVIQFDGSQFSGFIQSFIVLYLIISIALPISWIFLNDKFIVKLKPNLSILFDFHYRLRKKRGYDPNLVGIYLTSNRLCSKFNRDGKFVHTKISEVRWLPRKGKASIELNPFLHFREFSGPTNFQKQFLNIALAINEWNEDFFRSYLFKEAEYADPVKIKHRLFSNQNFLITLQLIRFGY
ncbi:MAG: hypothetical protein ACFFEO_11890 [Candidatus Thorarchaeota archaeon]